MARTFYRYVVQIEILSEEPLEFTSVHQIANACASDQCSGDWEIKEAEEIDSLTMVKKCWAQGTDPRFFGLDEEGNEV
jgi:hypothetical protein